MLCISGSLVQRRFTIQMLVIALACILFDLVAALAFRFLHLSGVFAYPMAALPAVPIMAALVSTGTYLAEETDEFQRSLFVQCMLGGIGVTLAGTTVWGYMEDYVHIHHLDPILVYPIFWISTALTYPVLRLRYR